MDRNLDAFDGLGDDRVALLAEGVDRNWKAYPKKTGKQVALLAEGVDRNLVLIRTLSTKWNVALLAEGVDRNSYKTVAFNWVKQSPSSRRAWIEMVWYVIIIVCKCVALLAEGVDRNL